MPLPLIWITEMNAPALLTHEEYELAVRELSALFDSPPQPGSPAAAHFEMLINLVDEFENKQLPL